MGRREGEVEVGRGGNLYEGRGERERKEGRFMKRRPAHIHLNPKH